MAAAALALSEKEVLPPTLYSTADPPSLFDGTTRLYVNYECPFCQRVWIVRNYKGLQEKIKLVAIHLLDKPAWYREKLYPENKVPALEHNGKVIGESLDLVKYVDTYFEGPALLPDDPAKPGAEPHQGRGGRFFFLSIIIERKSWLRHCAKLKFAEDMIAYLDIFLKNVCHSRRPCERCCLMLGGEFDYLETSLGKFNDGPFFLGQFSQVDAACVPFIERFHIFLQEVFNYDITSGRPKLAVYLEEMNKIDAYKQTKCDPKWLVQLYKTRYMASG